MTAREIIELAIAAVLFGVGIWLYRRPVPEGENPEHYGSQGAVLLIVVAIILAIHGSGLLRYKPSPSEIEASQSQ